jgi:hypothetical protein
MSIPFLGHYLSFFGRVPHRAFAAFCAMRRRFPAESNAALALPPFKPPNRPRATAAAFFAGVEFALGCGCPVDCETILAANWFKSIMLDRLGMAYHRLICVTAQAESYALGFKTHHYRALFPVVAVVGTARCSVTARKARGTACERTSDNTRCARFTGADSGGSATCRARRPCQEQCVDAHLPARLPYWPVVLPPLIFAANSFAASGSVCLRYCQ